MVGEQGAAVLAQVHGGLGAIFAAHVGVAALAAHPAGHRGQCGVARYVVGRTDVELGPHDPVHAALVVDEAAGAELRERKKPGTADHAALVILALDRASAPRGNPGHQRQAWEVVARQEALAGQVAVGVEVGVLGVARLQEHGVLAGGIAIAALRILLLLVGGGVALHHLVGHVHLLAGGIDHHAPAAKGGAELCTGLLHGGGHMSVGEPCAGRQERANLPHEAFAAFSGAAGDFGRVECRSKRQDERFVGLLQIQQRRDAGVQLHLGCRQPHGVQMAVDEIAVRQIERGRADHTVDHLVGMVEEPLVVRAQGRAVGDDQGLLPRAASTATALRVVGRRGRHVAQVDRVEGRDVDAQLHCGRAEHHRQTFERGLVGRVLQPVLAILLGVAEALFEELAPARIHLGGVLLRLEVEQRVLLLGEGGGDREVELPEEAVVLAFLLDLGGVDEHPVHCRGVQAPADQVGLDLVSLRVAVVRSTDQKDLQQLQPLRVFPALDVAQQVG